MDVAGENETELSSSAIQNGEQTFLLLALINYLFSYITAKRLITISFRCKMSCIKTWPLCDQMPCPVITVSH